MGIILQRKVGIKLQYTTKLTSSTTNNTIEYEVVIMTLRIVKEVCIQKSIIFSNSQLVVNQCQSYFKVRDLSLVKYEEKI